MGHLDHGGVDGDVHQDSHAHHYTRGSSEERDDSVKRQCFEHHRKQHYNMKEALLRYAGE